MTVSEWVDAIKQCFFIPHPTFTEKELPDQTGRVVSALPSPAATPPQLTSLPQFIVTGGYSGCGKELCKFLYQKNGTVYIAGRRKEQADSAMAEIKQAAPTSDGRLEFLHLDLSDLSSIKASAEAFLQREQRLDVLTNNAGVMTPPKGSVTPQRVELQMGTNCLGPFLFTRLLTPVLQRTAASQPAGAVRVTWAASLATMFAPRGGVSLDAHGGPKLFGDRVTDYAQSKAGNALLAREYQARVGDAAGIVSNAWNPGNLKTPLQRHQTAIEGFVTNLMTYEPKYGGYTELFAGWSPEAGERANRSKYIGPWGRFVALRSDVKNNAEGARQFWEYCERETEPYA